MYLCIYTHPLPSSLRFRLFFSIDLHRLNTRAIAKLFGKSKLAARKASSFCNFWKLNFCDFSALFLLFFDTSGFLWVVVWRSNVSFDRRSHYQCILKTRTGLRIISKHLCYVFCNLFFFLVLSGNEPPDSWPKDGRMELEDISVRYASDLDPVLKGINLSIKKNEKVRWQNYLF